MTHPMLNVGRTESVFIQFISEDLKLQQFIETTVLPATETLTERHWYLEAARSHFLEQLDPQLWTCYKRREPDGLAVFQGDLPGLIFIL